MPTLSVGIDLTGVMCVAGAVASLVVSVASSAWVAGVSAAGLPLCGCSSALPRASSKDGSFGEMVDASGCRLYLVLPGRVSAWPAVESARETPCLSPVEKPICTVRTHGLALRSLSIGRTSGDSSARCRRPRH